jgi:hypothetical protein
MDLVWTKAAQIGAVISTVLIGVAAAAAHAAPSTATSTSLAGNQGGPLTGTWVGELTGRGGAGVRIVIVVDASERGGSWKLSPTCHGALTLDSVSGGYHHYRRIVSRGTPCAGADVDCLKRVGANLYDTVSSHSGGFSGTLRRLRLR